MSWPLETDSIVQWARGFKKILILEEKRNIIEDQLARSLYFLKDHERPALIGKTYKEKNIFVPSHGELNTKIIKSILEKVFTDYQRDELLVKQNKLKELSKEFNLNEITDLERSPWFCAGCPHNTSTVIPKGSKALSGIGCHFMVNSMDRNTSTFTHMGGEGGSWLGISPFVKEKHIFQNIGDGTYFHSGILSIRAAVASGVNITFKILFNDAVALTGGQKVEGNLTPADIVWQLKAEGVKSIAIISNNPEKYESNINLPPNVKVYSRNQLENVQLNFRDQAGVTSIVYDQVCAAELRRQRKRKIIPEVKKKIFINSHVCEGCGDCNSRSNCVAVQPLESPLGRKRKIDQNICNSDFSCLDGFCPSFISIEGEQKNVEISLVEKKQKVQKLESPSIVNFSESYNILLAGIGGTGVVTVGAIISMAAHLDGNECSVLDQTGLSQKNGSVYGHIKIYNKNSKITNYKISDNSLDLILGFDSVVAASQNSLSLINQVKTKVFIENKHTPLPILAEKPDENNSSHPYISSIINRVGLKNIYFLSGQKRVQELFNNSTTSNIYFLGYAFQAGFVPITLNSLEKAINLNGKAIEDNLIALYQGMLDYKNNQSADFYTNSFEEEKNINVNSLIDKNSKELEVYQNSSYSERYLSTIKKVQDLEQNISNENNKLSHAIANYLFKLMAYKDEYYVSQLLIKESFFKEIKENYVKINKINFYIAPPFLSLINKKFRKNKIKLGYWFFWFLIVLSKLKFLRNTIFDPFRWSADRKDEIKLLKNYFSFIDSLEGRLNKNNYNVAVEIASLPDLIRGFGYIKRKNIENVEILRDNLMEKFIKESL